jgi:hypothetical protein
MTKRTVSIGINRYSIPGADIRGRVNDVKTLKAVLTQPCALSEWCLRDV